MPGQPHAQDPPRLATLLIVTGAFAWAFWNDVQAGVQLFHEHKETLFASYALACIVWIMAGLACTNWGNNLLQKVLPRLSARVCLLLACLAWLTWAGVSTFLFHFGGWDGCAYLCSGLALRGYHVPYASHRAPMAGLMAAVFADAPSLMQGVPVLCLGLSLWFVIARRWPAPAFVGLTCLLLFQNVLLQNSLTVMGELWAASLLALAVGLLMRQHFFLAGLTLALVGLARWNLAVVPIALTLPLLIRFGLRSTFFYLLGGAFILGLFLGLSFLYIDDPIGSIIRGNVHVAYQWAAPGAEVPSFWGRLQFYFQNYFFLTPPALACLILPYVIRRQPIDDPATWVLWRAVPVGLSAYMFSMLFIGAYFPRFMSPILPIALVLMIDVFLWILDQFQASPGWKIRSSALLAAWVMALGFWPGQVLFNLRTGLTHKPTVSPSLRQVLRDDLPPKAAIKLPALPTLSRSGGFPYRASWRRNVDYPGAQRTPTGEIQIPDDPQQAINTLLENLKPGDYFLLPKKQSLPTTTYKKKAEDHQWILWQKSPD